MAALFLGWQPGLAAQGALGWCRADLGSLEPTGGADTALARQLQPGSQKESRWRHGTMTTTSAARGLSLIAAHWISNSTERAWPARKWGSSSYSKLGE